MLYPASGTGASEAALVNVLAPGDRVLVYNYGVFSGGLANLSRKFGYAVDEVKLRWGQEVSPDDVEQRLRADSPTSPYRALLIVHNETSTGVTVDIAAIRKAIDAAGHDALFVVDTVSSLASIDFRMDEWGVDVTVVGSQKGLMLPTGMAFTGVSAKAIAATAVAKLPRVYWDWRRLLNGDPRQGYWNGTVPVHFFYGLQEALRMFEEEGLDNVFARHHRLAEATRRAVRTWRQNDGPELFAIDPQGQSDSVTAVLLPEGYDADAVRQAALEKFNISLGGGLGNLKGRLFRIGHLGDLNEAMVLGSLAAVEMAFDLTGVPHGKGGVVSAMEYLTAGA
jgi:alanine-glyoxylate transaminase / serine-glyoxylate transaminase / serine-pyruvate transaminase